MMTRSALHKNFRPVAGAGAAFAGSRLLRPPGVRGVLPIAAGLETEEGVRCGRFRNHVRRRRGRLQFEYPHVLRWKMIY